MQQPEMPPRVGQVTEALVAKAIEDAHSGGLIGHVTAAFISDCTHVEVRVTARPLVAMGQA